MSATAPVVVVAEGGAARLGESMVREPRRLAHWMSSSMLGPQRLLTAWALAGLDTGAAGQTLAEGPLLLKPRPWMVPQMS